MSKARTALLVTDAPGHILDRIGHSFLRHNPFPHRVVCSNDLHPWKIARQAQTGEAVHWINRLSFLAAPAVVSVPQVVMVHHMNEPEVAPFVELLPHADGITTTSMHWKSRLESLTGRPATLVPYTVDTKIFVPRPDRRAARRVLGIDEDAFVIAYSGKAGANAFGRKGVDILTAVLLESIPRFNATALLIGSGWDELTATLTAAGGRVARYLPETTEDTANAYPVADVLISTSREEGGPCTILEAMACEVPIITTLVGHVPEVVRSGGNGFVCGFDPAEFLAVLQRLHDDRTLARTVAVEGRRSMIAERDETVVIPRIDFDTMYRDAAERFRRRTPAELRARTRARALLAMRYAGSTVRNRVRSAGASA